ncbi:MAG: hypothetical protein OXI06_00965 [bacterium]|nr:hypothetical protein [bacterium]
MNSTVETVTSWTVGAPTVAGWGAWVVVVVVVVGVVVEAVVVGVGLVVVVVAGSVVAVVAVVGSGTAVVVVSGGDVEVVVALVVVAAAVVVVVRMVSSAPVEGGAEVESADVIGALDAEGSVWVCVSSDPVRHAPRSKGTTTTEAVSFLRICPESRAVRERSHRAIRVRFPPG